MDLKQGHTPLIVEECRKAGVLRNQCAYILGTAWHETGRYKYMREIWGPTAAQKRYEGRKDLGNTVKGDGKKFMGRGFVQITGRRNYTDWGKRLGLDLLKEPQLAERPEIAVQILIKGMMLGTFTGKKLSDYVHLAKSDFVGARRVVNGMDKAELIAGYARDFNAALLDAGYDIDEPAYPFPAAQEPAKPVSAPAPPPTHPSPPAATPAAPTGLAALIAAFVAFLTRKGA